MLWILLGLATAAENCAEHRDGRLIPQGAFVFTQTTLKDADEPLDSVVCALKATPELTVSIEAHTDSRGSSAYNTKVSQDRADAIRTALIARGIDGARIRAVGYGETIPTTTNTTAEGRATNRRIELHTTPPETRPKPPAAPEPVAPAPPPPGDPWCTAFDRAIAKRTEARWNRPGALADVADRMRRCLGPGWTQSLDGGSLYAERDGLLLVVEPSSGSEDIVVKIEATR